MEMLEPPTYRPLLGIPKITVLQRLEEENPLLPVLGDGRHDDHR